MVGESVNTIIIMFIEKKVRIVACILYTGLCARLG